MQITGGSTSTIDAFDRMRRAGAAARQVLLLSAAQRLGISASSLKTRDGLVVSPDGQELSYRSLASDAAKATPPSNPPLKPAAQWRYLGKSLPRLDMVAKVTGRAEFGIDTREPGMLYAAVRLNPRLGSEMTSYEDSAAKAMPGVRQITKIKDAAGRDAGVGAIATNTWRAFKAVEAVEIEWGEALYPQSTDAIFAQIAKAFGETANSTLRDDGDVDGALANAEAIIEAEYRVPFLAHTCMEPMNATARFKDGILDVWTGNQAPTLIRDAAATVAGISQSSVRVHTPFLGGGFGRRAEYDCSNQAVQLAMSLPGETIKLTWSREEDVQHDFYRPAAIARMKGVVNATGPTALRGDIAASSVFAQQAVRALGFAPPGPDKLLVEGAFDQPYGIANYQINGYVSPVAVPVGSWRSVGNSHNAFFHECFVDELAVAAKLDPVKLRLDLLRGQNNASLMALEAVAEMAGWDGKRRRGKGRGVAFTYSFGSPTAQIIEVSGEADAIRIDRVWCAIDVGTALDRRNVEAQAISAIIYGLSAAAIGEISFADGAVEQSNFHDYDALRMSNAPAIDVRVLENNTRMGGAGEPATPPSMPALANAVFDLTGKRIRELPLSKAVTFV